MNLNKGLSNLAISHLWVEMAPWVALRRGLQVTLE